MERSFLDKHDYWSYGILVLLVVAGPLLVRDVFQSSMVSILVSGFFGIIGFGIAFYVYEKPVTVKVAVLLLIMLALAVFGYFTRSAEKENSGAVSIISGTNKTKA